MMGLFKINEGDFLICIFFENAYVSLIVTLLAPCPGGAREAVSASGGA